MAFDETLSDALTTTPHLQLRDNRMHEYLATIQSVNCINMTPDVAIQVVRFQALETLKRLV